MDFTRLILSGVGYLLLLTMIIQTGMSLPNLALNRPASQSTTYGPSVASLAVDGRKDSCSHSEKQKNPWWTLDLAGGYWVTTVVVTNRKNFPNRLDGAEIRVGNSLENNGVNNPMCAVISHIQAGQSWSFHCGEMEGRYVTVVVPGEMKFVTLCEVEVYGCAKDLPPPSVNVVLGGRNVTLVGLRLCWSDALFYCRDHHWDLLSLTNEEQQRELKGLLGRDITFPLTPHLWLGLRRYLMGDKWFWMNGDHMTYSQWKWGYAPPRLSNPCGAVANGGDFLWQDRPCEEHLDFLCVSGAEEKDSRVTFDSSSRDKPHCP